MILLLLLQLWQPLAPVFRSPDIVLDGNWQSCREGGVYAERVYEHRVGAYTDWEFHMGPFKEFALFSCPCPEDDDHDSAQNLLSAHHFDDIPLRNGQGRNWKVRLHQRDGLYVEVHEGGGSREDCESYLVLVRKVVF